MLRGIAALLFLGMIMVSQDCEAQRLRIFHKDGKAVKARRFSYKKSAKFDAPQRPSNHRWFFEKQSPESRQWSNYYNNPASPLPKYIGGFHSSHFYNLGVPNGDLGFRGNGIYWAPW